MVIVSNFKLILHLGGYWGYILIQEFGCRDWVGQPSRGWLSWQRFFIIFPISTKQILQWCLRI